MQKVMAFEAIAIAQYINQNTTSAIKERPQETLCFSIFYKDIWTMGYQDIWTMGYQDI